MTKLTSPPRPSKGQSSIMEYLLMSFFVLVVIIVIIFFLSWWQFSQLSAESHNIGKNSRLALTEKLISSPMLTKENSVFEDSKLTAVTMDPDLCNELSGTFGEGFFLDIESVSGPVNNLCSFTSYPNCGRWVLCTIPAGAFEKNISLTLPVNIYRKAFDRTDLGVLRAGYYDV